jgi:DNA replication protein DnaC
MATMMHRSARMSQEIIGALKALKLHGMAANYPEVAAQARHTDFTPEAFLSQLLRAEQAERSVRSMAYQMGAARFPAHRDLAGFEFSQASVDEALVRTLHGGAFIEAAHNVVLIGGPGTGKTHLATAIGIEAIQRHGKRVRFFSTVELVNALELEKSQGKAGQLAHRLVYMDLDR